MPLLGFHAFTVCDLTGRFSGFLKATYFNTFLKSNSFVHKVLVSLGNNGDGLKEKIIDGLTFVLDLYQSERPSNINTFGLSLWYLFSKFQYDSGKLPPTSLLFVSRYIKVILCATHGESHCFQLHLILILKNTVENAIPTTLIKQL